MLFAPSQRRQKARLSDSRASRRATRRPRRGDRGDRDDVSIQNGVDRRRFRLVRGDSVRRVVFRFGRRRRGDERRIEALDNALLKKRMDAVVEELRIERLALETLASALATRGLLFEKDVCEILERDDAQEKETARVA